MANSSSVILDWPDNMFVLPDGRVFITEMWSSRIKLFTPGSGLTEVLAISGTYNDNVENGLLGLAIPPDFATTNWVYVFYSRRLSGSNTSAGDGGIAPHAHALVRYTFAGGKLTNPKDILLIPRQTARHAAGGMTFNPATGDLYIGTGDDTYPAADETIYGGRNETSYWLNSLRTSANTNDLRGKLLRIRPLPFADSQTPVPGAGTTYAIPSGNLFAPGTDRTRPEIYTMGHRNPYKFKVDTVSGIGLIGEVGPDANGDIASRGSQGHDEFNLVTGPGNYGWPFGIADNQAYTATAGEAYPVGTKFNMNALKNISKLNTGLEELPAARSASGWYNGSGTQKGISSAFGSGSETAISGPYYRYDANLVSDVKLPAFFHGKFIVTDWNRNKIWALEFNSQNLLSKVTLVYTTVSRPIDLQIGPKGELYVLEFAGPGSYPGPDLSGKLSKLEYTGTQYAPSTCSQYVFPGAVTSLAASGPDGVRMAGSRLVNLALIRRIAAPAGTGLGILYSLSGAKVWEGAVENGMLDLPASSNGDLRLLRFR
ncbi:MAG: PQQ-dependent sugar dehydrogenase [Fibrobacteria bacterium]